MTSDHHLRRMIDDLKAELRLIRTGLVRVASSAGGGAGRCELVHELYIDGNPSSGSFVWSYTIDSDTQDVTIAFDDEPADVLSAFTTAFSGVDTADLEVTGGPLPNVAIYVEFDRMLDVAWPPVQGTNTLNNSAEPKLRRNSP